MVGCLGTETIYLLYQYQKFLSVPLPWDRHAVEKWLWSWTRKSSGYNAMLLSNSCPFKVDLQGQEVLETLRTTHSRTKVTSQKTYIQQHHCENLQSHIYIYVICYYNLIRETVYVYSCAYLMLSWCFLLKCGWQSDGWNNSIWIPLLRFLAYMYCLCCKSWLLL